MSEIYTNFIDGEWTGADDWSDNVNPADVGEIVGRAARASPADIERAIAAANAAFPAWSGLHCQERADILMRAAQALRTEGPRLALILSREQGRPLRDALAELTRSAQTFEFFAGEVVRTGGEIFPSTRPGTEAYVTREPLGVIGMITPWNVPSLIPSWKIAAALAYGNCVVIKPAELTPASAFELVKILDVAGLPKGVLNLVMGRGSVVGDALLRSADVDAISFTGSVETGHHVAVTAVQHHKKVQCEMGGKNPLVILDDADLEISTDVAIDGGFFWAGQRCTASERLIVQAGIHDRFVARMLEKMAALRIGDPLDQETQIGPVVDERQLSQNLRYIDIARDEGGEIHGGERLERERPGHYMSPALILHTRNDWRINREEIFGPVSAVIRVADYAEALAVANDTEFGLSSGICTNSLDHSTHFRRHSRVGVVAVNLTTTGSEYHVAFGGRKASSFGAREQGRYAMDFYTAIKTSYVRA